MIIIQSNDNSKDLEWNISALIKETSRIIWLGKRKKFSKEWVSEKHQYQYAQISQNLNHKTFSKEETLFSCTAGFSNSKYGVLFVFYQRNEFLPGQCHFIFYLAIYVGETKTYGIGWRSTFRILRGHNACIALLGHLSKGLEPKYSHL